MNDETALRELLSMCRIYRSRGQSDKAEECMALASQIQGRIGKSSHFQRSGSLIIESQAMAAESDSHAR